MQFEQLLNFARLIARALVNASPVELSCTSFDLYRIATLTEDIMCKIVSSEMDEPVSKRTPSISPASTDHPVKDGSVMTTRDDIHALLEHNENVPERIDLQAIKKIWHSAKVAKDDMPDTASGSDRPADANLERDK